MTDEPYLPVPEGLREEVRLFLSALKRHWRRRTGTELSQNEVARIAHIRQQSVQRIYEGKVALPPGKLQLLLGESETAGQVSVGEAYLAAYGRLYPSHTVKWIEDLVRPAAAPRRPGAVEVLERVTRMAMLEANRLVGHQAAELFLRELYVPRRFTGSREVCTEAELEDRCDTASVTVIVGEPGTGKTSALWRLIGRLRDAPGRTAWLVPAGGIGSAVPIADLTEALRFPLPGEKPPVLLVDTVDLLLRSDQVPPELDEVIRACSAAGAALVMTCRPRECRVLRPHAAEYEILELVLGPYGDDELPTAVEKHAKHFIDRRLDPYPIARAVLTAVARGLPIAQICQVPLTLRMLFELHQLEHTGDHPVETEIDVTDLFDKYWRLRVRTDARTNRSGTEPDRDLSMAAETLAVVMLAAGTPRVGDADTRAVERVAGFLDDLETLVRRSVVHEVAGGPREFFHQTFFEYAVARAIVAVGPSALDALVARTIARPDDAFLGAVTQQTLVHACRSVLEAADADEAFAALLGAAGNGVQQVAVAAYAQARFRGPRTAAAGRRLLAVAGRRLVRHYLVHVARVRREDPAAVLEDLQMIWQRYDDVHVRAEVLGVLRSLAVVRPEPILDVVAHQDAPYLAWYLHLTPEAAQLQRRSVIELLGELAPADPEWCAGSLEEVARVAVRPKCAQDGVAAVLMVAAECGLRADRLRNLLAVIPAGAPDDASGANELGLVAAGIIRQIWVAEDADLVAVAEDVVGGVSSPAALAPDRGWSPPRWLAGPARLRALAELACDQDPAVVDRLIAIVLSVTDKRTRTEVGNYFLKHLLGGRHRVRLPGGPEPADTTATKTAWKRCAEALRSPEPAPSRGRSDKALWRDALYAGYLPPAEVAGIVAEVIRAGTPPGWLDADQLAPLLVPAALGGIPGARAALTAWSGRGAHRPGSAAVRKVLMPRLEHLSTDFPEAFDHLLGDAAATTDGAFLDGALTKLAHKRLPLPAGFAERVAPVVHQLLASRDPGTIRHGFAIAARVDHGRIVEAKTIMAALRMENRNGIRDKNALKAVLNLVGASLEHDADRWTGSEDFDGLDDALQALARTAPDPILGRRAYEYRCTLYCHSGPIGTVKQRRDTLDRVRELVLAPGDHLLLEPLGRLLSRLVPADPEAAATLLVDTSATVERIAVADTTNSWKSRRAIRLRHPVRNVMVGLSYGSWKRTITALAEADVHIFVSAIDVSIRDGTDEMVAYLRRLVEGLDLPDNRAETSLRTATTHRQRITGAFSTWPELRDLWLARPR